MLVGDGEERIFGEEVQEVGGVRGGVNPPLGIEAAEILFVLQVIQSVVEQCVVALLAQEWSFQIAFGEHAEAECGEGAAEDAFSVGFADAGAEIGLPFIQQRTSSGAESCFW